MIICFSLEAVTTSKMIDFNTLSKKYVNKWAACEI